VNDSSPVPAHVVQAFITKNPSSLQQLWYRISIIAVCQNKYISGEVLQLLLSEGPKDSLVPVVRKSLFKYAIQSENKQVIGVLINHFPWALSEKTEPNNEIPLHSCHDKSSELISFLLEEGIRHRVGGHFSVGGLFIEDINGESLFDKLVLAMSASDRTNSVSRLLKWERLQVCIQYAHFARVGTQFVNSASAFPFSCVGFIPSHLLDEAIEVLNFNTRSSDVFDLIEMATSSDDWKNRFKVLNSHDLVKVFKVILTRLKNQMTEKVLDSRGRHILPLHFGALRGLQWESGLKEILFSDYTALRKIDQTTGFMPLMNAACGSSSELNTIYNLLLSDPSQINIKNC
jgi:hypothetical protein